jgi:hypothetical protein
VDPEGPSRSYPISLKQVDIDNLNAIKAMTKMSHGEIIRPLLRDELKRLKTPGAIERARVGIDYIIRVGSFSGKVLYNGFDSVIGGTIGSDLGFIPEIGDMVRVQTHMRRVVDRAVEFVQHFPPGPLPPSARVTLIVADSVRNDCAQLAYETALIASKTRPKE